MNFNFLENHLMREIKEDLNVANMKQFNNIFIINNIPLAVEDSVIRTQVENTLASHNAKIVDKDKDIQIILNESNAFEDPENAKLKIIAP